jgi:hypothetical protein
MLADDVTPISPEFYDGALPSSLAGRMPRLRTYLDRLTRDETTLLAYHGYWWLHAGSRCQTGSGGPATAMASLQIFRMLTSSSLSHFWVPSRKFKVARRPD